VVEVLWSRVGGWTTNKRAIRAIDAIGTVSRMVLYDTAKQRAIDSGTSLRHRRKLRAIVMPDCMISIASASCVDDCVCCCHTVRRTDRERQLGRLVTS
jgi:hypothetical protein